MLLGLLGDIHGDFGALEGAMTLEPHVPAWLCVGDVAGDDGQYPSPSRPVYFIKGNNEDFDLIARLAAGETTAPNLHYLSNGRVLELLGIRVVGLGGTFAPTWYDTAPEALPWKPHDLSRRSGAAGAAAKADKRRHFVRQEVQACAALREIDVFLTHEAARPYWVGTGRGRNDAGKTAINEILAAMKPRLHVFGHHHRLSEAVREGVPSIGLPLVAEGYGILDTSTWVWTYRARQAP